MAKYLDQSGVQYLWGKIKAEDAKKLDLAGGTLTGALILAANPTAALGAATKQYVDSKFATAGTGDMVKSTYDTDEDGLVDNAAKVNGHTVLSDVPANAKFTDTVYTLGAATADTLGGVKIGTGIDVAADGTISVNSDITDALDGRIGTLETTVGSATSGLVKKANDNTAAAAAAQSAADAAQDAADAAQADVDALAGKVGTVPADTTVVDMISAAQTAATYDDTALTGRVAANESAIATLNGTGAGSVSKAVADGIATVVASAPENFDTLKEVADWIANDTTGAAAIQNQAAANATALETLNGDSSVTGSVDQKIAAAVVALTTAEIDTICV